MESKKKSGYEIIIAFKKHIGIYIKNISLQNIFKTKPLLHFGPDISVCLKCGNKLHVNKTRFKMVSTMVLGRFKAHETILECPECKNVYDFSKLKKLIPYRCSGDILMVCLLSRSQYTADP